MKTKNKTILFAHWGCEDKTMYPYQNWFEPLKKAFKKVILFDPRKNYFQYGKQEMNEMFLNLVRKTKPDVIFFCFVYDEFYLETFDKIRLILPKVKLLNYNSDDSWRFNDYTRYTSLFMDYFLVPPYKDIKKKMKKEGIKNYFISFGVNTKHFKPLILNKTADVSFIGSASKTRANYLKFLIKNRIKVCIYGKGWESYPSLKRYYYGSLNDKVWTEIVNKTRINLCFSESGGKNPQLKGRPFEIGACKSFILVGYAEDYKECLKEGKEIIMFKGKQDLLKKIKFYLKNEKIREKIAENAYKKIISKYTVDGDIKRIFEKI